MEWLGRKFWILSLILAILGQSGGAEGRNAQEIGNWLASKIFEGDSATLAFCDDGFFGMKIAPQGKPEQNITGLWRLAADGISLTLYTLQDASMNLSVGNGAIYGSLAGVGSARLLPVQRDKAKFRITGLLKKNGLSYTLQDAASGKIFHMDGEGPYAEDKFATAEIEIGQGAASRGRIIKQSSRVPRIYALEGEESASAKFEEVAERYWLLPSDLWPQRAALRFSRPAGEMGSYDISGPGLRLEGKYALSGSELKLAPDMKKELALIGADKLARALAGAFVWKLTSRGLKLEGNEKQFLLLAP